MTKQTLPSKISEKIPAKDSFILRNDGMKFFLEAIDESKVDDYTNDSDSWFGLSRDDLFTLNHMLATALAGKAPRVDLQEDA